MGFPAGKEGVVIVVERQRVTALIKATSVLLGLLVLIGGLSLGVSAALSDPGAPSTTTPTKVQTPVWTWAPSAGADHYQVRLGTAPGLSDVLAPTSVGAVTTWTTATTLTDGRYYLAVSAWDAAETSGSNWVECALPVVIDTSPPLPPATVTAPAYVAGPPVAHSWSGANDPLAGGVASGIASYDVEIRFGSFTPIGGIYSTAAGPDPVSWTDAGTTFTQEGTHWIRVWAVDAAGNKDAATYATTSFLVDLYPPSLGYGTPTANSTQSPAPSQLTFDYYDGRAGFEPSALQISYTNADGSVTGTAVAGSPGLSYPATGTTGTSTITYTLGAPLPDGYWTVTVDAGDRAGRTAQYQWSFTVDSTPPVVDNFRSARGATLSKANPVQVDATSPALPDGSAGSEVDWTTLGAVLHDAGGNSITLNRAHNTGEATATLSLPAAATPVDGAGTIQVTIKDWAHNQATATWPVTVDTAPPGAPANVATTTPYTSSLTPTFTWEPSTDPAPGTGVVGYRVSVVQVEGSLQVISNQDVGDVAAWTFPSNPWIMARNTYRLDVRAVDAAGNVGPAGQATALLDQDRPWWESPFVPSNWAVGPSVTVSARFDDTNYGGTASGLDPTRTSLTYHNNDNSVSLTVPDESLAQPAAGTTSGILSYAATLTDGKYTAQFDAFDRAGNQSYGFTWTFNVDSTPPAFSNQSPAVGAGWTGTGTIRVTIGDPAAPDGTAGRGVDNGQITGLVRDAEGAVVTLTLNSFTGGVATFSLPGGTTLAEGAASVEITAKDLSGNTGTTAGSWTVSVDRTGPAAPTGLNTGGPTTDFTPTIIWNAAVDTAPGSGISTYWVRVTNQAGGNALFPANVGNVTSWTLPAGLSSGYVYTVHVWAVDTAGNPGSEAQAQLVIDTWKPSLSGGSPSDWVTSGSNVALQCAVSEDGGGGFDPSRTSFTYHNADNSTVVTVPVGSLSQPAPGATSGNIAFTGNLADGTWTATVEGYDLAGNKSDALVWTFQVDSTPPAFSAFVPAAAATWTGTPITVAITDPQAPDGTAGRGLSSGGPVTTAQLRYPGGDTYALTWTWDGTTATLSKPAEAPDGPVIIEVTAQDGGSASATTPGSWQVTLDARGPNAPANVATANPFTTSTTPSFTWDATLDQAPGSGLSGYWVEVRNTWNGTYPIPATGIGLTTNWTVPAGTPLPSGKAYEFRVWAKDGVGNGGAAGTVQVTVDQKAPTLGVALPSETVTSGSGVEMSVSFFDGLESFGTAVSGLDSAQSSLSYHNLDSSVTATVTAASLTQPAAGADSGWIAYTTNLADGQWTATANAADRAGNATGASTWTFTVDSTPPVLSNGSPAAGATWNGSVPITIDVADPAGPDGSSGSGVNTSAVGAILRPASGPDVFLVQQSWTAPTMSFSLMGGSHPNGVYTVVINARDSAGNPASPVSWQLMVDTVGPGAPAAPSRTTPPNDPTPQFSWGDATDPAPGTGIGAYWVKLEDSGGTAVVSDTSVGSQKTWTVPDAAWLASGSYTLTVWAVDGAGNAGTPAQVAFTVDTAAPTCPTTVTTATPTNDSTPSFTWSGAADPATPGSGLSQYRVELWSGGVRVRGPYTFARSADPQTWTMLPGDALTVDGTYEARVWSLDLAGNVSAAYAQTSAVFDGQKPVFASAAPADAAWLGAAPAELACTFSDAGGGGFDPASFRLTYTNADGSVTQTIVSGAPGLTLPATGSPGPGAVRYALGAALTDGQWTVTVDGKDLAGNAATQLRWVFHVDTRGPAAINLVPANGGVAKLLVNNLKVDFVDPTAPDGSAGSGVAAPTGLLRDGSGNTQALVFKGWTGSTAAFGLPGGAHPNGSYTVEISAADTAGNTTPPPSPWQITVDTSAPNPPGAVTASSPTRDTTPTFTWTAATDSGTGIAGYKVSLVRQGVTVIPATAVGNVAEWTVPAGTPLANDSYSFSVWAVDGVGYEGSPGSVEVTVDTWAPFLSSASPTGWVANTDNLQFTFSDIGSGASGLDPSRTVFTYHNADNSTQVTVPVGALTQPGAGSTSGTVKASAAALGDGTWSVSAQVYDLAGNTSEPLTWTLQVDATPPAYSDFSPTSGASWTWGDPLRVHIADPAAPDSTAGRGVDGSSLSAALRDSGGNLTSLDCSWDALTSTVTLIVPAGAAATFGDVTVDVEASDLLGNALALGVSWRLTATEAPPDPPSVLAAPSLTNDATPTVTWSGDAQVLGSYTVEAWRAGARVEGPHSVLYAAGTVTWTSPNPLADGTYAIRVWSVSAAGTVSDTYAEAMVVVDTTPPDLDLLSPPEGAVGVTLDLGQASNVVARTADGVTAEVRLDSGEWTSAVIYDNHLILVFLRVPPSAGLHTVSVRVYDAAGNVTEKQATFAVDLHRRGFGFGRFRFDQAPL